MKNLQIFQDFLSNASIISAEENIQEGLHFSPQQIQQAINHRGPRSIKTSEVMKAYGRSGVCLPVSLVEPLLNPEIPKLSRLNEGELRSISKRKVVMRLPSMGEGLPKNIVNNYARGISAWQ